MTICFGFIAFYQLSSYGGSGVEIVKQLKDSGEDYQFYPTKPEQIEIIRRHMRRKKGKDSLKVIDIGAGRADVGVALAGPDGEVHTIEKSGILRNKQPKICRCIGCNFEETTFIDKAHYDIAFCNPPYQASGGFAVWMEKIIREVRADLLYFIVPERWENNDSIQRAIRTREANYEVVDTDDFLDGERAARAKVQIVFFDLMKEVGNRRFRIDTNAPYDNFLEKEFGPAPDKEEQDELDGTEMVIAGDFVQSLVENYNGELAKLMELNRAWKAFTVKDLAELGLDKEQIFKTIKTKIAGLKAEYWRRLFGRYAPLNKRLTWASKGRLMWQMTGDTVRSLDGGYHELQKLQDGRQGDFVLDFNIANAYMVTEKVCMLGNDFFDRQAVEVYKEVLTYASVIQFKSNRRFVEENFRWQIYQENELPRMALRPDVRFILNDKGKIATGYDDRYKTGAHAVTIEFLEDLRAVARNLGFECKESARDKEYTAGKNTAFLYPSGKVFMLAKVHNSGTLHLKMDQEFLKAWTILVSRLGGWVRSPKDFANEVDYPKYSLKEINRYWEKNNFQIGSKEAVKMLSE